MHADSDSGLENAIPHVHNVQLRVDERSIQRMSDRTDKALGRSAGQLRIGVEREHKADVRQLRKVTSFDREGIVHLAEHLVQIQKLAALSLPAHPSSFTRIVDTVPMKKVKAPAGLAGVLLVQPLDQIDSKIHPNVLLARGLRGVR